jgi:DNA-binding IclR family transcriptional regulator
MYNAPNSDGTVGKAMQVLDQVASFQRPVRFSELLANSPFPKPTLYRFVQTLTNQGMLTFDAERQTYSMGIRLVSLAHSAWRHSSLAPVARPYIEDLAAKVGEAVHLAQLDNGHVLFVDKCKVSDHFETLAQAGKIAPG